MKELLESAGLLPLLAKRFGKRMAAGSFDFDLMPRRDLDIWVPLGANDFTELFPELVACFDAAGMKLFRARYNDEIVRPRGDYGSGLYFGLHVLGQGEAEWKIDLWGWPPDTYCEKVIAHERLKRDLSRVSRTVLLEAKSIVGRHPGFGSAVTSYSVYRAALEDPTRTANELTQAALHGSGSSS